MLSCSFVEGTKSRNTWFYLSVVTSLKTIEGVIFKTCLYLVVILFKIVSTFFFSQLQHLIQFRQIRRHLHTFRDVFDINANKALGLQAGYDANS